MIAQQISNKRLIRRSALATVVLGLALLAFLEATAAGFELGTGICIHTAFPEDTAAFLKFTLAQVPAGTK